MDVILQSNGPFLTTPYGNFASPLSRLSLFNGMAAGMHAANSATICLGHMMNGATAGFVAGNNTNNNNDQKISYKMNKTSRIKFCT
ncbi:hypothetical protein DERF_015774 [Dermatophagoides farinae]|nr:hypothetical protein DERF_015774 [Dermatophagoides farinae]